MNSNNSNNNTCEASTRLFRVKLYNIIVYLILIIINYKSINRYLNKLFNTKKAKDWDIWTEETRYDEKDNNIWYIIPGRTACRYKGEWKNGLANGKGVKEYYGSSESDHSIVEGNFVDGYIDGFGRQTYDKSRDEEIIAPYYEGEFKDGVQHGNGAYYYGNGCYRKGNLVEGKFEGKGIYYCSIKNQTWVGDYVNDKRENGTWNDGELTLEAVLKVETSENKSPIIF